MMRSFKLLAFVLIALIASAAAPRPNIVVIMADDMGFSDAGCMGGEISTPNLDRLAAGGLRFTQFYNTARCCPTRAALLTGLYPHQADVGYMTGNGVDAPGYRNDLSRDAVTIAEVLRPAGYSTYMTGKWHVTSYENPKQRKDNWPRARGFDRFYGTIKGGGSYYDPAMLVRDDTPITPESDPEYRARPFYYTDAIADQSSRFILEHHNQQAEKPFFLYVAFTAPHWPLHAPDEAVAKYKGKYDGGYEPIRAARFERMKQLGIIDPMWQLSPAPQSWADQENEAWEARCMEVYAAQIELMDAGIGRIIESLRQTGELDDTLILFLQDNGGCSETMGRTEHKDRTNAPTTQPMRPGEVQLAVFPRYTRGGEPILDGQATMPGPETSYIAYGEGWANVSNTPLRMYKHHVHEGGISTPLIAHWPGGITRKGELEKQPGHLIDLMPTFVEMGGAMYPQTKGERDVTPMQGVSLAAAFAGKPLDRAQPIFFEHEGNRAIRDGKWKLVAKGVNGKWELYDIEADRSEMNDLSGEQPERVSTMAAQWQQWAEKSNVLPLVPWQKKKGS